MAFPNLSDVATTTIDNRSRKLADNVRKMNAVLTYVHEAGHEVPFDGGQFITQEMSFAENANAAFYSGSDPLPIAAQDVLTAAQFNIKQAACAIAINGLEQIQNSGRSATLDLLEGRIGVGEKSLFNLISGGIYSDGTGFGGKQIDGLNKAVPIDPTTGTYGGINRAVWTFWRSFVSTGVVLTASNIQHYLNVMQSNLVRGMDKPKLVVMDNQLWQVFVDSLQALQRFTDSKKADLGFPSVNYMGMEIVLDGGIGGFCPAKTAFFLNTDYLFFRPYSGRNFKPLAPNRRFAVNQDAEVTIIGWAGNMTSSGSQFQGRLIGS